MCNHQFEADAKGNVQPADAKGNVELQPVRQAAPPMGTERRAPQGGHYRGNANANANARQPQQNQQRQAARVLAPEQEEPLQRRQDAPPDADARVPPERCGACPSCCKNEVDGCQRICGCCIPFALILMVILLPISFVYFEFNQIGFVKYTITNNVDTTQAYTMGRYYTGPSHAAVPFPREYQRVDSSLAIFPDNGQEFTIHVVTFFRLEVSRLAEVYEQFGTSPVVNQVSIRVDSEIKSIAPNYQLTDYIVLRQAITDEFFYGNENNLGLQADLDLIGCVLNRDKFWMAEVEMPAEVMQRNLDAVVQLENNQQEENEREAILVETETSRQKEQILANITAVNAQADATVQNINAQAEATVYTYDANANAQINRASEEATAQAQNLLATTDGSGLNRLFTRLGITDISLKKRYIEYFALLDQMSN